MIPALKTVDVAIENNIGKQALEESKRLQDINFLLQKGDVQYCEYLLGRQLTSEEIMKRSISSVNLSDRTLDDLTEKKVKLKDLKSSIDKLSETIKPSSSSPTPFIRRKLISTPEYQEIYGGKDKKIIYRQCKVCGKLFFQSTFDKHYASHSSTKSSATSPQSSSTKIPQLSIESKNPPKPSLEQEEMLKMKISEIEKDAKEKRRQTERKKLGIQEEEKKEKPSGKGFRKISFPKKNVKTDINKLKILIGERRGLGNSNPSIVKQGREIIRTLLSQKAITNEQSRQLLKQLK